MASALRNSGVLAALGAAALFGAGTPIAKAFLSDTGPLMFAGLLYLGAGIGLGIWRLVRRLPKAHLVRKELGWLIGAVVCGGVLAPGLLMVGLTHMPATGASLLLNAEAVFTALIAWLVFRENIGRKVAFGMLCIVAGAAVLSWPGTADFGSGWPILAVLSACLLWAVDNNLTRNVNSVDATWIAMVKGIIAGSTNVALAFVFGEEIPALRIIASGMVLGLFAYGVSLVLFVIALRGVGAARAGAYYSVAPFIGAIVAIAFFGEAVTIQIALAGGLMAVGTWLHLTESHSHFHPHSLIEHEHEHFPDTEHRHGH
ncbi:MAG: EamA family transporter [Actinobacteria bacterium]|uniref:Unannotated protein n=2 Tax=freshwater metagenome TaxID=449393 RepID=A0A6J7FCX5_9ZZZZ|nr:EamA family transporter [Actinomycetota bacterium]